MRADERYRRQVALLVRALVIEATTVGRAGKGTRHLYPHCHEHAPTHMPRLSSDAMKTSHAREPSATGRRIRRDRQVMRGHRREDPVTDGQARSSHGTS